MPGDPSPPVKRMVSLIVVATIFAGYGTAYLASDDVRYVTRAGLEEIAEEYGVDELLVVTVTNDYADRLHSYELLAQACGLTRD